MPEALSFDHSGLDLLMPMHLLLAKTGEITHAGPTLCKLLPERDLKGRQFGDVFRVSQPRIRTPMRRFPPMPENGCGCGSCPTPASVSRHWRSRYAGARHC